MSYPLRRRSLNQIVDFRQFYLDALPLMGGLPPHNQWLSQRIGISKAHSRPLEDM